MRYGAFLVLLLAVAGAAGGAERVELLGGSAELELSAFRVWRDGAAITVHLANGATRNEPWPATRYFRGSLRGEPDSLAIATIEPDGRRRGWLLARGRQFLLSGAAGNSGGWLARPADESAVSSSDQCAAEATEELAAPPAAAAPAAPAAGGPMLAAVVAVETDFELFQFLGSTSAVASHVADVLAAVATVYRRDLGTDLELGDLFVWADPADPFTVESGFSNALNELGDHWHAEHSGVDRTLAHLMSGKTGIAGGIAYHGVLCRADAMVAGGHWGGGYSLTGSHLAFGGFRDIFVTAHELGHNFRAYHTHCFNDLPNGGEPEIDRCTSGEVRNDGHACYSGPVELPADGGSIMSYCHLLSGGYGNIHLSLGKAGSYGDHSERVIDRMRAHVDSVSCLVPANPPLFADGFESGDLAAWSAFSP